MISFLLPCEINFLKIYIWYGEIKDRLRKKGRPIPENDIWIAAIAFQHDLILISRDEHFREVEDLKLEEW